MKRIFIGLLLVASTATAQTNTLTDDQLGEKLAQAVMFGRAGLYDEAEALCKQILAQKPDQMTAKQLLHEIEGQRHRQEAKDPGYALRHKVAQIVVPEIRFREATPVDVIEYLRMQSKALSPDKSEINFVWQVPADVKLPSITLSLKNVPLTDVLDYVTQLAKLKYRIDAHAVVIYVPEPTKPVPAATEPNVKSQ